MKPFLFPFMALLLLICSYCHQPEKVLEPNESSSKAATILPKKSALKLLDTVLYLNTIKEDVRIKNYFQFLDSLVIKYDSLVPYPLTEHLLVHANPWIIDSLVDSDYYTRMNRGEFIYDQRQMVILRKGNKIYVPAKNWATRLIAQQNQTQIDINIPEYKLRIVRGDSVLYTFLVRVGQNKSKYLATAGREEDLRTRKGEGHIFKIKRHPTYINPVDGHIYESTLRDDKRRTLLPIIPFLHTEINGHRWGQLIHPTTNPASLGKAYSNGCIGTAEGDAWRIYYFAPVGTKVKIRYDLKMKEKDGSLLLLDDIYHLQ